MTFRNPGSEKDTEILGTSYQSFLLRCWLEEMNGDPSWRFTLIQLREKSLKRGFADLEAVISYVQQKLTESETNNSGEK